MWASFGPIEAEAGHVRCGKRDPEFGAKTGACPRDFGGLVVEHDVFVDDKSIGEIDAEAARKMVVANSGRTNGACLRGKRAEFWSLLKSDGDDPFDHLCHFRRSKPEIAVSPITLHRKQTRFCQ